jgi:hypothetical protein
MKAKTRSKQKPSSRTSEMCRVSKRKLGTELCISRCLPDEDLAIYIQGGEYNLLYGCKLCKSGLTSPESRFVSYSFLEFKDHFC